MVPPRILERGVTLHAEYYEEKAAFVPAKPANKISIFGDLYI
jgi:hypothetical protein